MILNNIYDRPKCENCGKDAIGLVRTVVLCGECIVKWDNARQQKNQELKTEILNDINGNKNM